MTLNSDDIQWYPGTRGRGPHSRHEFPAISITVSGSMTINAPAMKKLGYPERVQLGFDEISEKLAIRAVSDKRRGSYTVSHNMLAKDRSGSVNARPALEHFGIERDANAFFALTEEERGVFTAELATPVSQK